jgi:PadR family transcriptional regulator, regulatory protein PadR
MRRELARGTVVLATLSALGSKRRYGYELMTLLNEVIGGAPLIKEGTLYPLLHRLEDAGHITSEWETQERRPARKYYLLTEAGAVQLERLRSEWEHLTDGMARLFHAMEGARQ